MAFIRKDGARVSVLGNGLRSGRVHAAHIDRERSEVWCMIEHKSVLDHDEQDREDGSGFVGDPTQIVFGYADDIEFANDSVGATDGSSPWYRRHLPSLFHCLPEQAPRIEASGEIRRDHLGKYADMHCRRVAGILD